MRLRVISAAFIALAFVSTSCSENDIVGPTSPDKLRLDVVSPPSVRISEFHYDNTGTDIDEKIEISGPAGTSLSGYSLVLYNGNSASRAAYTTTALSGTIPATCGGRGVVVISYPSNGLQNGGTGFSTEPDGIALVNGTTVIEFLSYEGSFIAASGVAAGLTSTNIGVGEAGTEATAPRVTSLQRNGSNVWSGPLLNTFGACNDSPPGEVYDVTLTPASASIVEGGTQQFTASAVDESSNPVPSVVYTWSTTDATVATVDNNGLATGQNAGDAKIIAAAPNGVADTSDIHVDEPPPDLSGPVFISELHYDNDGADVNEAVEVEGPAGLNLAGWSIVLYNGNGGASYATLPLTGLIPVQCTTRGTVVVLAPGIQNGSPDGLALVKPDNTVVEFISYEGGMTATNGPAAGMVSTDIGVDESTSSSSTRSLMRYADSWYGPQPSTFNSCNPAPPPPFIQFTGRTPSDPALPVGFQDQLFAKLIDASGDSIHTEFTWSAETPGVATIDANGVITAVSAGSATFRATATLDGTTDTYTLPTRIAVASATAVYAGNAEFGEPTDADASDDFIIHRDQYTISYNQNRGTPNWVSYDLEISHFGPEDRCDCFTFDPLLPAGFTHYTTADYTGAGAFHGYGIDRGHFARSFDRTSASLDNATTYYFSNIIPQASAVNQGPWATMENELGNKARFDNKEVYIIAGVIGSKGTLKNEGKIVIPAKVWKVAVIMPKDEGLADVHSYADVEVIAVIMPNDPVINSDWKTYKTTVDAVEAESGYNLLALLPDPIEIAVESNTKPPTAATSGPYTSAEGDAVSMSGAGSTDPDGDALTYDWDFGDGSTGTGAAPSHTYAQDGSYNVQLIVTDILGLADTITTTANVSNVAPSIGAFAGATLLPGETYSASGSFTDPGADSWTATVDYGAGAGVNPLSLSGKTFTLSNVYNASGVFTVTVRVSDDDVTSTATQTVTVLSAAQAIDNVTAMVNDLLTGGVITSGNATSLLSKLDAAKKAIERGQTATAASQLNSLLSEINSMVASGRLTVAQANDLRVLVNRIIDSIT